MNRTERLQALIEELHAVAPAPRTTRWLAERFAVSQRTIERDTSALAAAGAPVYPVPGHHGYAVDPNHELPPVSLTVAEAVAVSAGLSRLGGTALAAPAETAQAKLTARFPTLPDTVAAAAAEATIGSDTGQFPPVPVVLQDALRAERVLDIDYTDRRGAVSHRTVEPIGFVGTGRAWHLLAWCRMRHGIRAFRLDRIRTARLGTDRVTAHRELSTVDLPTIGFGHR